MKKRIKIIIDVLLTVTLLILMAYQVTGRQFHEYAGAFMLVLSVTCGNMKNTLLAMN